MRSSRASSVPPARLARRVPRGQRGDQLANRAPKARLAPPASTVLRARPAAKASLVSRASLARLELAATRAVSGRRDHREPLVQLDPWVPLVSRVPKASPVP